MNLPGALTILLSKSIDYAGLFPPAALSMKEAVSNFAQYFDSGDDWALGRFIVPVARLAEFSVEISSTNSGKRIWVVSALAGSDVQSDVRTISEFNSRFSGRAVIDTIELKSASSTGIERLAPILPKSLNAFVEIPIDVDPSEAIRAIAGTRKFAKVRTGGVTADAFPTSRNLARFLAVCARYNVRFKATAGLHHPLRGSYRLTYDALSNKGKMYGYLNVFLASAFFQKGMEEDEAAALLEEETPSAFRFEESAIAWRTRRISSDELRRVREQTMVSFGSCSFTEPMEEIVALSSPKSGSSVNRIS